MAWSAPVGVEVYEDRDVGFENFSVEFSAFDRGYRAFRRFLIHHARKVRSTAYKHIDEYLYASSEHFRYSDCARDLIDAYRNINSFEEQVDL